MFDLLVGCVCVCVYCLIGLSGVEVLSSTDVIESHGSEKYRHCDRSLCLHMLWLLLQQDEMRL